MQDRPPIVRSPPTVQSSINLPKIPDRLFCHTFYVAAERRTIQTIKGGGGARIEMQVVEGSKLKLGQLVRATPELRDKLWFPSIGIPGT
jgi:hypothetical protein